MVYPKTCLTRKLLFGVVEYGHAFGASQMEKQTCAAISKVSDSIPVHKKINKEVFYLLK